MSQEHCLLDLSQRNADRALSQERQASHLGQSKPYSRDIPIMSRQNFRQFSYWVPGFSAAEIVVLVRAPFGLASDIN